MNLPFSHPWVLVLLVIPALLLMLIWRRSDSRVVLPFDHGQAKRGRWLGGSVNLLESVAPLLLGVVILILAGPQQAGTPKTKRELTNIEFCVDISGSMMAPFGDGTRYDASMAAIDKFLDYRQGDAFGLTFFGNNVLHWAPLTTDVSAIKCAPPFMAPNKAPPWFGGTEIGKALVACRKVLREREAGDRMIVLVSDGSSSDLQGDRTSEVIGLLTESNIVVHAIHISDSALPDEIVEITSATGGEVYQVDDPGVLAQVFSKIDKMQQTKLVKLSPETFDHYQPYSLAGLGLLGLMTMGAFGLRYTPW